MSLPLPSDTVRVIEANEEIEAAPLSQEAEERVRAIAAEHGCSLERAVLILLGDDPATPDPAM